MGAPVIYSEEEGLFSEYTSVVETRTTKDGIICEFLFLDENGEYPEFENVPLEVGHGRSTHTDPGQQNHRSLGVGHEGTRSPYWHSPELPRTARPLGASGTRQPFFSRRRSMQISRRSSSLGAAQ